MVSVNWGDEMGVESVDCRYLCLSDDIRAGHMELTLEIALSKTETDLLLGTIDQLNISMKTRLILI